MVPLFMFHGNRRGFATYLQTASMSPTPPFPFSRRTLQASASAAKRRFGLFVRISRDFQF
jgi:hypothetical protein